MKHIAIDARIISSSTGTYIERILHYLEKIDKTNKYSILVFEKDINYWKPTNPNFTVKGINFPNYSFSEQIGFKKYLDELAPDLVHFCMPQQPILYKGNHVTTVHDLTLLKTYNSDKQWLMYHFKQLVGYFVFRSVVKSSTLILSPSYYTKKDIVEFYKTEPNKIIVTHLAADVFPDKLEAYKHLYKQFILYVGQQSDYKNIRALGDAHQQLLNKYPKLGLILVGKLNASAKNNKEYFDRNNYKNITFTDFIPNSQRDWLYTKASAYIFPSLMEGFGLPGLEAMGYGAPVVSSNATCLPEVYGDAAIYFDPESKQDIANSIDKVLSDQSLRKRLINKGYKKIKEYSWEKTAQETHKAYIKALARK